MRKDDFHETACSRSVPLRDLDDHEATCEFQTLVCDLCDEEEDEEVDVRLSANLSPGKESPRRDPGDGELAADSGGTGSTAAPSAERRVPPPEKKPPPAPCGLACLRRDMPSHMAECGHRQVDCPYGTKGRRAAGAARRGARTTHAKTCVAAPRPCPNGCGLLRFRGGPGEAQGDDVLDAVDRVRRSRRGGGQGGPDGKHRSWCDARCSVKIRRVDLGKHRRESCEFARAASVACAASSCRCAARARTPLEAVFARAQGVPERLRRDPPPRRAGALRAPGRGVPQRAGPGARTRPGVRARAAAHAPDARGALAARHRRAGRAHPRRFGGCRRESGAFRAEVDDHRVTLSADAEKTRADTSAPSWTRGWRDAAAKADAARAADARTRDAPRREPCWARR